MDQQGTKFIFIVVLFSVFIFYFGGPTPSQIKNSPAYLQSLLQLKQQLPEEIQERVTEKFGISKLKLIQKQWKEFIGKQQNYGLNEELLDEFYKAAKQLYLKEDLRRKEMPQVSTSDHFLQNIKNVNDSETLSETDQTNQESLNSTGSEDTQTTEVQLNHSLESKNMNMKNLEQETINVVQPVQQMPLQINQEKIINQEAEYQNILISQEKSEGTESLQPEQAKEAEQEFNQLMEMEQEIDQNLTDLEIIQLQEKQIEVEQYAFKFLQSNPRFKLIDIGKEQEIQIDATRIFLFALFSYFLFIVIKKLMKWKKKINAKGTVKWKNLKNKLIANI